MLKSPQKKESGKWSCIRIHRFGINGYQQKGVPIFLTFRYLEPGDCG